MTAKSPNGAKRGRPRDPIVTYVREELLPMRSARTQTRYKAAMDLLIACGLSAEQVAELIDRATRANGSFNVNRLWRYAQWIAAQQD
jgi:hypothetical protein